MYEISIHAKGEPIVRFGPMQGCRDFTRNAWLHIGKERAKQRAIELCQSQSVHSVVTKVYSSVVEFDNGLPPADLCSNEVRDKFLPVLRSKRPVVRRRKTR